MKRLILLILMGLALHNLPAQSFYSETGTAEFTSSVPLHTFTGTSTNLTGMIKTDEKTVDFFLDLETLETGNAKRDKDMLITLETDDHPFAEFFGKITTPFDPDALKDEQPVKVKGNFKIHGVEKEIEVTGTITVTEEGLHVKAGWVLNLEDYKIEPPSLLIIKVDKQQKIAIDILLEPYTSEDN